MDININVAEKRATVTGAPVIICGNSDYALRFTFDEEWTGLEAKTARFVYVQDGEVRYTDVAFIGDNVAVPTLSGTKEVRVGVFAGDLHTSTPARIPCELSILCGTGSPADPTPAQYDQIMALLNALNTPEWQDGTAVIPGLIPQYKVNGNLVTVRFVQDSALYDPTQVSGVVCLGELPPEYAVGASDPERGCTFLAAVSPTINVYALRMSESSIYYDGYAIGTDEFSDDVFRVQFTYSI